MYAEYGYSDEKPLGKAYDIGLFKRLYPYVRPYRKMLSWAVLIVLLISILELALPYVTKLAIDRFIVPQTLAETDSGAGDDAAETDKTRFLPVDLTDPKIRDIVQDHTALFTEDGDTARIPLSDLDRLTREEITILRAEDLKGVARIALVFIAIILLQFILNFLQVLVLEYAGQGIMHDLRIALFSHLQNLSLSFFNRNPIARLVTRTTNDIQNMHELFTSVIVFVFKDFALLVGITGVMLAIDWRLALICFTVLPFVLYASLQFSRRAREVFRILRIKTAEINTRFSETIAGMRVIQLFRREKDNFDQFRTLNHEFYDAGMEQVRIFAVFMPLIEILSSVALALVIYFGGAGVLSERITIGVLVAFISYMRMFFRPIRDIAEKYNVLQNAMSSAERIFLLLDTEDRLSEPALEKAPPAPDRIESIELEDVCLSYIPHEPVLRGVSLRVEAGETMAIVGPTGSGKTSLTNLIARFYDPTAGMVRINDRDIREWRAGDLRSRMALVSQDPFLFSESIRSNIVLGDGHLTDADLTRILEESNSRAIVDRLPEGLDTPLSEAGASLSSGERQLISIARAFARNPELIILDEATSYIDSETEVKIQQALANLMRNRTAILVAHRLSTARHADNIIVLHQGRIIESGTHFQLMDRKGFYYRLNRVQKAPEVSEVLEIL